MATKKTKAVKEETAMTEKPKATEKATSKKRLIARRPILYYGREYLTREALPDEDPEKVKGWIEEGSAVWE